MSKIPKVTKEHVVMIGMGKEGRVPYLDGKPMTEQERGQVAQEVAYFRTSLLYKLIMETLKEEAMQVIFYKSKDFQDVLNGKTILHTLDVQEKIMDKFT